MRQLYVFASASIALSVLSACGGSNDPGAASTLYSSSSTRHAAAETGQLTVPGFENTYTISRQGETVTVTSKFDANISYQGANIQLVKFADSYHSFDTMGIAGQTYRLYQAAFDRKPDPAGLGYWIANAGLGVSFESIAAGFSSSPEFISLYGASLSDDGFVTQVYQNVLHRNPDESGKQFWINALGHGYDRAYVLNQFSSSDENNKNVNPTITNGFTYVPDERNTSGDTRYIGVPYRTHDQLLFILDSLATTSESDGSTQYKVAYTLINRNNTNIAERSLSLLLSDGTTLTKTGFGSVLPGDDYSTFDGAVFDVPKGKTPVQLTYGADPTTSASDAISFKFPIDTTYSPSPPKGFVFQGGLLWKDIVFVDNFVKSFADAQTYCQQTVLNGQSGWRLPTQDELRYLAHSLKMPVNANTWSSTRSDAGSHFSVNLSMRDSRSVADSNAQFVTCVR